MQKSQLINVLRTFSKKEIRDCRKWLYSPYHNQREDCRLLFDYLCEHLYTETDLDKEVIYRRTFSRNNFDDAYMRQVIYFLLHVIESFLAYETFKSSPFNERLKLAESYRKRNIDLLYQKTLKKLYKINANNTLGNEDYFHDELRLLQEEHAGSVEQRSYDKNLQEISNRLDHYFIVSKLKQACLIAAERSVYDVEYDDGILPAIITHVEQTELLNIPAVSVYYYIYKSSLKNSDPEVFLEVKKQITEHIKLFPSAEASAIYLMTINYCLERINKGQREFVREAFLLYQQGVEKRVFIVDGIIDRFLFRNIITAGSYLKEFDWLEWFVENHKQHLTTSHRDDYVNLSRSMIFYHKKDYNKAMRLLTQYDFRDTLINLNGKAMLIKMYYELGELTALESLLDSAIVFVKRKKGISNNYKLISSNLIKYTKKLLRVNPYDKAKREKLRKEILAANPLIEKRWFLEQLEKL